MNLEELDPKLEQVGEYTERLSIICPVCRKHRIDIVISPKAAHMWKWDGKTLTPSVRFDGYWGNPSFPCAGHFTITEGQLDLC